MQASEERNQHLTCALLLEQPNLNMGLIEVTALDVPLIGFLLDVSQEK